MVAVSARSLPASFTIQPQRINLPEQPLEQRPWQRVPRSRVYSTYTLHQTLRTCRNRRWKSGRGSVFHAIVSVMAVNTQLSSPSGVLRSVCFPGIRSISSLVSPSCRSRLREQNQRSATYGHAAAGFRGGGWVANGWVDEAGWCEAMTALRGLQWTRWLTDRQFQPHSLPHTLSPLPPYSYLDGRRHARGERWHVSH